ncbi:hypothetical protein GCM10009787_78400 [Streptomyces bangladeshensis]|uniref:Uncharacterized protein n=1 Tax=Streptomyces bangladeshensis TaxID=295352 RepID=A0ABN1ZKT1_9ACTN
MRLGPHYSLLAWYCSINGLVDYHGWAPAIVADALSPIYAFAYAVASALAAWEIGRLREAAVWVLAPARSRFRIAANILFPVVTLAWFMLILAAALRLIQEDVAPNSTVCAPWFSACCCAQHMSSSASLPACTCRGCSQPPWSRW